MVIRPVRYIVFLLLAGALSACDSGESTPPDSELLIGKWTVTSAEDATGDQTAAMNQLGSLSITFQTGGTFVMELDAAGDGEDLTLNGPYALDEASSSLTMTVTYLDTPIPLEVGYQFEGEDRMRLTMDSTLVVLLNSLLGSNFQGTVRLTLDRA